MGTSVLHIKTEVECLVYLFDEKVGVATPEKYFNLEVRKGEQELLFVRTSDRTMRYSLLYQVEESDSDYRIIISESLFDTVTAVSDQMLFQAIQDEFGAVYSRDGLCLISGCDNTEYVVKSTCKVICDRAFSDCNSIKTIILPNGLTHIGKSAFSDCWNLCNIELPESLLFIGQNAFYMCLGLSHLTIPRKIEYLGNGFVDKHNNHNLRIECNSINYKIKDGCLIDTIENRLVAYLYNHSYGELAVLPMGLKTIGDGAFSNCQELIAVTLPDSLESIGDYAFMQCNRLTSIKLPSGLTKIGDYAFANCKELSDIIFPENLACIGDYSFMGCSFSQIVIPQSLKHIGEAAFAFTKIKTVICNSPYFQYIDNCLIDKKDMRLVACFSDNSEIRLPSGIAKIGDVAFSDSKVNSVVLPEGLISIGVRSFSYCENLSLIELPRSLSYIGVSAFVGEIHEGGSVREPISRIYIPKGMMQHFEKLLPDFRSKLYEIET